MQILWFGSGAQVIILQAVATYCALGSAYFFARPVLRDEPIQGAKRILENIEADDEDLTALIEATRNSLDQSSLRDRPLAQRDNRCAVALLVASTLIFT